MHHRPRTGASRRSLRIVLVAVVLLASGISSALARQATPVPDGDTRTYVGHGARLTARIPSTWVPDRTLDYDYAGSDGFIFSASTAFSGFADAALDEACGSIATNRVFDGLGRAERTIWRDRDACIVRTADAAPRDPVGLVFGHPEPSAAGRTDWVVVIVNAAHFDEVTDSIAFDLSGVTAAVYLDAALDIMETRSIWRDAVDWDAVRERAHARLGSSASTNAYRFAHAALRIAVQELLDAGADQHTGFITPRQAEGFYGVLDATTYTPPEGATLERGVGYVAVPGFAGNAELSARFAGDVHAIIADQAPEATCGWILDLRENTGGAIPPMVGGLSPLLEPGVAVTFRDADGGEVRMSVTRSGAVAHDGVDVPWILEVAAPIDARASRQPVAVLIGPRTASAGEATAIAFTGRDATAFFGRPTAGMATAPTIAPLIDGAVLMITSSWMSGPHGAIYPDGLAPDVEVSGGAGESPQEDPAVQAATDWLRQQPGCDLAATPAA